MFFCSSVWPFWIQHQNKYCVYFPYRMHFYHSIEHSSLFLQTNGKSLRILVMLLRSHWVYPQALWSTYLSFGQSVTVQANRGSSVPKALFGDLHIVNVLPTMRALRSRAWGTVRTIPSMLTGGKHWRKIGVCIFQEETAWNALFSPFEWGISVSKRQR